MAKVIKVTKATAAEAAAAAVAEREAEGALAIEASPGVSTGRGGKQCHASPVDPQRSLICSYIFSSCIFSSQHAKTAFEFS